MTHLGYRCFAKVNLCLEVLRRREDGYHDLVSVVHTISLADELHIATASGLASRVEGLQIAPESNLVTRAAHLLASAAGVPPWAELSLVKHIPAAAGLGGGSSDAATTLVGLNTLWATHLSGSELSRLATRLGSDVPFFIDGGAALMTGRGEQLEALPALNSQWLVVVATQHHVETKTALLYSALEPDDFSSGATTRRAAARLKARLPLASEHLRNVFARAARRVFPGLAQTWTFVERICERQFFLSGAGPGLFALASDRDDALRQHASLTRLGMSAFTASTVPHARGRLRFPATLPSGTLRGDPRAQCLVVQW